MIAGESKGITSIPPNPQIPQEAGGFGVSGRKSGTNRLGSRRRLWPVQASADSGSVPAASRSSGTDRGDATEAPGFPAGLYWPIESKSLNTLREGTMEFTRITADPRQLGGVACIRRLRIPVATVVGMVAEGMTTDEILAAYPDLDEADVREALRFAAAAVRERELPLASTL